EILMGEDPLPNLAREWLVTNGTGAYAMGTALGINTRRYHGLLVAAQRPPVGRIVALNQVLEQLTLKAGGPRAGGLKSPGPTLEFSSDTSRAPQAREVYVPAGRTLLRRSERGLTVTWQYEAAGVTFTRELLLHWKQQAATLRYTVRGLTQPARLKL